MAKALFRNVRSKGRKRALQGLRSEAQKEIRGTMDRKVKPMMLKAHEVVVADWRSDVGFAAKTFIRSDSITVYVYPTGKDKLIWTYVDKGTKPHLIPKHPLPKGKFLSFKTGYHPKTGYRAKTFAGGGVAVGPRVFAKQVNHPGSEGRDFTGKIGEDTLPDFRREAENAFRRAARRTR